VADPQTGESRTITLSRGRFVSCKQQYLARVRPRGPSGKFLPGSTPETEMVDVVVSPKWVPPSERAAQTVSMPFLQLIGRVPELVPEPPTAPTAPPRGPTPPRGPSTPPRRSQRPAPALPPPTPPAPRRRAGRTAPRDDVLTLPPASRAPARTRERARDHALALRQQALSGAVPVPKANQVIRETNLRWGLGIPLVFMHLAGSRRAGRQARGQRDPMPASLSEWTELPSGGWVWTSAEGPSFEVVPSPTLEGIWLLGWFDLPDWAHSVVPRDVRREHLNPTSAIHAARDLYSLIRMHPKYRGQGSGRAARRDNYVPEISEVDWTAAREATRADPWSRSRYDDPQHEALRRVGVHASFPKIKVLPEEPTRKAAEATGHTWARDYQHADPYGNMAELATTIRTAAGWKPVVSHYHSNS